MNTENSPGKETLDQPDVGRARLGRGFYALWIVGLAVAGALSYRVAAEAPEAEFTLPAVAIVIFGVLAGGVQGVALRRQAPPVHWWLLASSLAGLFAAGISLFSTSLARSSVGLLAGWAYAWAAYGALLGVALLRFFPSRWVMLVGLAGWATAGMVGAAAGWAADVCVVRPGSTWDPIPTSSRAWSVEGLAIMGAVFGAAGGAITAAALAWLLRLGAVPPAPAARETKDARLATFAGATGGLIATAISAYLIPLVVSVLVEGSLAAVDMGSYMIGMLFSSVLCLPAAAVVTIPLGIGSGHMGWEIGRARGSPDVRPWIWGGAAVGGVAGTAFGFLLVFAALSV